MLATLDDENKQTRVYTCRILKILYETHKTQLSSEQLNQMYTELLKRLDDSSDEIRNLILDIFDVYFKLLISKDYDKVLYQAHIQVIYQGLLIHLDDTNQNIQDKTFGNSPFLWNAFCLVDWCDLFLYKRRFEDW